jgi:hypothetical protein
MFDAASASEFISPTTFISFAFTRYRSAEIADSAKRRSERKMLEVCVKSTVETTLRLYLSSAQSVKVPFKVDSPIGEVNFKLAISAPNLSTMPLARISIGSTTLSS